MKLGCILRPVSSTDPVSAADELVPINGTSLEEPVFRCARNRLVSETLHTEAEECNGDKTPAETLEVQVICLHKVSEPTREEQLQRHFESLTGKYKHWCYDWDGMPVDEHSMEWPCSCVVEPTGMTRLERVLAGLEEDPYDRGQVLELSGLLDRHEFKSGPLPKLASVIPNATMAPGYKRPEELPIMGDWLEDWE